MDWFFIFLKITFWYWILPRRWSVCYIFLLFFTFHHLFLSANAKVHGWNINLAIPFREWLWNSIKCSGDRPFQRYARYVSLIIEKNFFFCLFCRIDRCLSYNLDDFLKIVVMFHYLLFLATWYSIYLLGIYFISLKIAQCL